MDFILNPWSSKNQASWRWPPQTGGTCGVYDRFQANLRRAKSVHLRNSWSKANTACVCVCLGWRMVDHISGPIPGILHGLQDLAGCWWISHFLQVFLKNLPNASWNSSHLNSRALRKSSAPWRFLSWASSGCISRPVMAWENTTNLWCRTFLTGHANTPGFSHNVASAMS